MKKLLCLLVFAGACHLSQAQLLKRITDRATQRAEQKVQQKIDEKVDKAVDKTVDGATSKKVLKKKDKKKKEETPAAESASTETAATPELHAPASLLTDGQFSTQDIVFGDNSDRLKMQSFNTLKEIASVLKDNADLKVKIVSHVAVNSSDDKGADLAKRRAEAVKAAFVKEFEIDEERLEVEGKTMAPAEGEAAHKIQIIKLS